MCANFEELEKCCQTHIFLQKFRFDTAENEPALQPRFGIYFAKFNAIQLPIRPLHA